MAKRINDPAQGKANPLGLPALGKTDRASKSGKKLRGHKKPPRAETDPRREAFSARCRQMGLKDSPHNRSAVNVAYLGSDLGRVLREIGTAHDEILRIWHYFQTFAQVQRTYRGRILSLSIDPKCAGLQMIPERIEAHPDDEPDTRTAEERDDDARAAYRRWNDILDGGMDPSLRVALLAAERGDGAPLWKDAKPTLAGYDAARAVTLLADLAERDARKKV